MAELLQVNAVEGWEIDQDDKLHVTRTSLNPFVPSRNEGA